MKQTEVGLIPDDWEMKKLETIALTAAGGTPLRSNKSFYTGNVRWFTTSELKDCFLNDSNEHISQEAVFSSSAKIFPKQTLLMAMYGATIGRLGILNYPAATNQACCAIIPEHDDVLYLYYYLLHNRESIVAMGCGAGQPNISQEIIKNLLISLPPLEEQRRIAKALSDVDALITTTEKLIQKKKNIKQGTMQNLLTGKKRLPGFAKSTEYKQTELGLIPEDWEVRTFGDYVSIVRGGSPRPIQNYLTTNSNGINWIKIGDVKPEDKYIFSTEEKIIPEGKSRSREVHKGDFILSNSMSFGRPYILQIDGCIHDGWLAIQNYQETFDTDFLYYLLGSDEIFKQYIEMAAGSSVQNLNKEKVAKLLVPIVGKKEQTAIANVLSSMDKEIEILNTKLEKYRNLKTAMMQQLLTGKIRLI